MKLHYHPGKANVVADVFSCKSHVNTLMTGELPKELAEDLRELCLEIVPRGYVTTLEIQSTLMDKIREAQKTDKEIAEIKERVKPPGNERKTYGRTTLTYFLANPNLKGEIHLKGGRFVTYQIFNLECYTLDHHCISYFITFWFDPRNSTQLKERVGDFVIFIFEFSQILKRGSFGFNYFPL